ncbi:MAG: hypothetical protein AB1633_12555 [Elusimicrobiota bacterium]
MLKKIFIILCIFSLCSICFAKENLKNQEYIQWKNDLDNARTNYKIFNWTAITLGAIPLVALPVMIKDNFRTWLGVWVISWCAGLGSYFYAGTFKDEIHELEYHGKKKGYISLLPAQNQLLLYYTHRF